MTPIKCSKHELRPGELADGPRYSRALVESLTCVDCQMLGAIADERWTILVWLRRVADEIDQVTHMPRARVEALAICIRNLAERIENAEHRCVECQRRPTSS